jgi:hypothetical protein
VNVSLRNVSKLELGPPVNDVASNIIPLLAAEEDD